MVIPLDTAPPCAAASDNVCVQPCEAEVKKCSRSQMRKLRDRRVAVRRAIRSTIHLQESSGHQFSSFLANSRHLGKGSDEGSQSEVLAKLDHVASAMVEALTMMRDIHAYTMGYSYCYGTDDQSRTNAVLSYLDPCATEFLPESSTVQGGEDDPVAATASFTNSDAKCGPEGEASYRQVCGADALGIDVANSCTMGDFRRAPESFWEPLYEKFRPHPVFEDVAGSQIFKKGDIVLVIEGVLKGYTGTVSKPGGGFSVQEGVAVTTIESLCSVQIDNDPSGFHARPISQSELELYESEPRRHLKETLTKCLSGMEHTSLPEACNKLLLPLLRKAADTVENGSAQQCAKVSDIFSARLDQVAEEIFLQRAPP